MKRHGLWVLCPVDFSESSRRALRYAAALAGRFDGRLTVLFVEDALLLAAAVAGYERSALARAAMKELHRFVNQAIGRSRARSVGCAVSLGIPAREIEKAAKSLHADLIVMGTHGLRGAKRLFFGSTTRDVLKRAPVPVLAVPRAAGRKPSSSWPGHHFLAGIEPGKNARTDTRAAAEFAHVRTGNPADAISAEAARLRIGLIVLVLRGKGGVFGPRPGSITYQVLCQGLVPVAALPSRFRSSQPRGPSALKAGLRALGSTTFL